MESRIILSQADFSQNNIGRYVELSELTKKVLAKQTQYDEQSVEAAALNVFLDNLTNDGFIGGDSPLLKTLIIPALASQHSQLLYDIATLDENGYPTNKMSSEEINASTKYFLLEKDSQQRVVAMYRNSAATDDTANNPVINSGLFNGLSGQSVPAFSMMLYVGSTFDSIYDNQMLVSKALNYKARWKSQSVGFYYNGTQGTISSTISNGNGKGLSVINYNPQTPEFTGIIPSGSISASTTTGGATADTMKVQEGSGNFAIGVYYTQNDRNARFSLIAFGDTLSSSKITEFKTLVDTFMTAIHVNS